MNIAEKHMNDDASMFRHHRDVITTNQHADQMLRELCGTVADRDTGDDLEDLYGCFTAEMEKQVTRAKGRGLPPRGLLYSCDYYNYLDSRIDYLIGRDWEKLSAFIRVMRAERKGYDSAAWIAGTD